MSSLARRASIIREKLDKVRAQLPFVPRAVRLVWRASPRLSSVWLALLAVQGALPVATVFLVRALVDAMVAALAQEGWLGRFQQPMMLALAVASVVLATELTGAGARWVRAAQSEHVRDHISELVQSKSVALDLAYYESPEYFDQLHRVIFDMRHHPLALLEGIGLMLQNSLTLAAMVVVLLRFGLWIPIALVVSTLPALWIVLGHTVRQHEWRVRNTPEERRCMYYQWLLTTQPSAAEIRLFDLGEHFRARYRSIRARLRDEGLELARDEGLGSLVGSAMAYLIAGAALALMVWRTLQRQLSLGDLAMFVQAFNQGQRLLRSLLGTVGELYASTLFLSHLFEFLELEPRVREPERPLPARLDREIRFRDVSFQYPGAERWALEHFDLVIPAGKVVAVVGENGAGKSTLVKLLCRFYDPSAGAVEMDGVDLRATSPEQLRRSITVLFQEPVHYNATVRDNLLLGNVHQPGEDEAVRSAARAAGAERAILELPEGYDTLLGKWFAGGTELSVGEWQRVALARAFFRDAPLVLLDEPTSAMDSWAENEWMERFRALVAGRTALVITHRFTTAMRADIIHVMVRGRVVESGTHGELVAAAGLYASSWRAQMGRGQDQGRGPHTRTE